MPIAAPRLRALTDGVAMVQPATTGSAHAIGIRHQAKKRPRRSVGCSRLGVFHNGASSLPVVLTKDGVAVNDGSLAEVHAAAQEVLINQVRQGILAEKLGFQSFWLTEHHFQPEGAEMSPNPLFTQMAIASQTKKIRLGQCANIVVWHIPSGSPNRSRSLT
jgi:Luciferase-like monooxygenase